VSYKLNFHFSKWYLSRRPSQIVALVLVPSGKVKTHVVGINSHCNKKMKPGPAVASIC
jgi:hypothetical protein